MLKAAIEAGSALLFPRVCETCDEILSPGRRVVCEACASEVRRVSPPFCPRCGRTSPADGAFCGSCEGTFHFDRAYAALRYEGPARDLMKSFKYGGRRPLGAFFSDELCGFMERHIDSGDFDVLAAVPIDAPKESERGFNQAGVLCRALAKFSGKPDLSAGLVRRRSSKAQSFLGKSRRAENVAGSFETSRSGLFEGKKVLLVDDVLTTGATAGECARVLKSAGAVRVTVLAAARAF